MGERQRREHGAKTRDEPCGARAVREGGDSRAHVEQHLEMIDRRAGPEKVFVVLKLKQAEREDEAEPETAGGAAGTDDQNGAEREEADIPEQADDGKVYRAGEPVARGEKQAAHDHAMLVIDGEQLIEKDTRPDAGVQAHDQRESGLKLVPVGDIATGLGGAEADVDEREEGQTDEQDSR